MDLPRKSIRKFPQSFESTRSNAADDKTPQAPLRRDLQRRHSTGCVAVCNDDEDDEDKRANSGGFWQVYEQDITPKMPIRTTFTRRPMVRFEQHVTVWVFAKNNNNTDAILNDEMKLPQSFVRRSESRTIIPLRKPRRRRAARHSSEYRFKANGEKTTPSLVSLPSMPSRQKSTRNCQLPLRSGTSSHVHLARRASAPPQIPQRQPSLNNNNNSHSVPGAAPQMPQRRPSFSEHNEEDMDGAVAIVQEFFAGNDFSESEDSHIDSCTSFNNDGDDEDNDNENHSNDSTSSSRRGNLTEEQRRERAKLWWLRWAMPSYEIMKDQVQNTPGLDITLEDVDLLPWDSAPYNRVFIFGTGHRRGSRRLKSA